MSPSIATILCFGGIGYLLWADRRGAKDASAAVWIPFLWMFFAASRFPSQWWNLGPNVTSTLETYSDGSPMDRYVFLLLILAGVCVLLRRQISWPALAKANFWLLLFFAFAAVSVLWSDDPFVAFKRWIKGIGMVVMALVLLTEKHPYEALGVILRRLAFILLPLSVLFIKYHPELGRAYHMGVPTFTGVTFQKNALGQISMLVAIYFAWMLLLRRWAPATSVYRPPLLVTLIVIALLAYLLSIAQSATALAVTMVATGMFALATLPYFAKRPKRLAGFGISFAIVIPILEQTLHLKDSIIRLLGRQPDLTERVPLWDVVLELVPNPWVGAGYESFWMGDRVYEIWTRMGLGEGGFLQAHNGYIDLYANLGLVGVSLMLLMILVGTFRVWGQLVERYAHSMFRLALILTALLYNYTEAAFQPLNNVFLLLLFSVLVAPTAAATVTAKQTSRRFEWQGPPTPTANETRLGPTRSYSPPPLR